MSWTPERRAKIAESNRQRQWTEESRKKLSEAGIGRKGTSSPLKGKTFNEFFGVEKAAIIREKRRISQLNSYPPERREKIAQLNKQRIWTDEAKKKISNANKGRPSKLKGKHRSEETIKKMRAHCGLKKKGKTYEQFFGSVERANQVKEHQKVALNKEERKAQLRESAKKILNSPEAKKKQAEAMKKLFANPEVRAKYSKIMKERMAKKVWTEEDKQKISLLGKANRGRPSTKKGKHLSDETKRKISMSNTGRPKAPYVRIPESIRKMSITLKKKYGKYYSEAMKKRRLSMVFPKKDTKIEVRLQKELSAKGLIYTKHFPIKGQPDIAFPNLKIAIFCDGDYWHSLEKSKKRDSEVNDFLTASGWIVLRYSEKQIKKDTKRIANEIQSLVLTTPTFTSK